MGTRFWGGLRDTKEEPPLGSVFQGKYTCTPVGGWFRKTQLLAPPNWKLAFRREAFFYVIKWEVLRRTRFHPIEEIPK